MDYKNLFEKPLDELQLIANAIGIDGTDSLNKEQIISMFNRKKIKVQSNTL